MALSLRQWLVVLGLIVGFGVAAFVVSRDGGGGQPAIDTVLWCTGAEGLAGTGGVFTGESADVTPADVEAVKQAIFAVEVTAPYEIRNGLARLADLTIVMQQLDEFDWPEALVSARSQVDEPAVDEAIAALETEMQICGLDLFA